MKRTGIVVLVMLAVIIAGGCSSTSNYNDGQYMAQSDDYDASGWMDVVVIDVEGGKITAVDWTANHRDGGEDKKTLSEKGEYSMGAESRSQWHEQAKSLETALINNQDISKITVNSEGYTDAVSGVTVKVNEFAKLAKRALDMAK